MTDAWDWEDGTRQQIENENPLFRAQKLYALVQGLSDRAIVRYKPYEKQKAFHQASQYYHERLLMAGNQLGKTFAGAFEMACHAMGVYPSWWEGVKYERPVRCWVAGVTNKKTRDVVQLKLVGERGKFGKGSMIPAEAIAGDPVMNRGVPGLIDYMRVKHRSGGESWIGFMSYEMSVDVWQSDSLDMIWFDEEPPAAHYDEGLARTTATGGHTYLTFTPLHGMSDVVRRFYPRPTTTDRWMTRMEIEDADHIPEEHRKRIIDRYPAHQREARARGIPLLGSGAVYETPESIIEYERHQLPEEYPRIVGLDLGGGDHPTAAVWMAYDRDSDSCWIYDCYKVRDPRIAVHADAIMARGKTIPVAWPHDAHQHSRESGQTYKDLYKKKGLNMCHHHAQFESGENGVEGAIAVTQDRLASGRLKVAKHLVDWWDEYRTYHRDNGKVVAENDDLMKATHYALMMLRYARVHTRRVRLPSFADDYDPLGLEDLYGR